jgi:hypothetical protein
MTKLLSISFFLLFTFHFCPADAMAQRPISMAAVSGAVTPQQPLGRFEVFVGVVSGSHAGVYHTWQPANQSGWLSSWPDNFQPAPDDNPHGLVAARDGIGRIVVAWISKGDIHFAEAIHPDVSMLSSDALTIKPTPDRDDHKTYEFNYLVIALNSQNMVEILALNKRGRVFSIKQPRLIDDGNPWIGGSVGAPVLVGGGDLENISVTNLNGGLALAATGKNGQVYIKTQTVPGTWDTNNDNWANWGGDKIKEVRAQQSSVGQLEIIALGTDKKVYLQFQNVNPSTLSGWELLLAGNSVFQFGPAIFFDHFKDKTLFVVSHEGVAADSQYAGAFGKAFQSPNNGAWSGQFFGYIAVTSQPAGFDTNDGLGYLSPNAFALAADAQGNINYFACYSGTSQVEHYVDQFGASSKSTLTFEGLEYSMPKLPW